MRVWFAQREESVLVRFEEFFGSGRSMVLVFSLVRDIDHNRDFFDSTV